MKNIKKYLGFTILLFLSGIINAQVAIGALVPDVSSILDLSSTTKGLLIPRLTTAQQILITSPGIGLLVFNTTTRALEVNIGDGVGGPLWFLLTGAVGATGVVGPQGVQGLQGPAGTFINQPTGVANTVTGVNSTVGGGSTNSACGLNSTISGGTTNTACGENSFIGGGTTNSASALNSSVVGGTTNRAVGVNSSVGGGTTNWSRGLSSSVSGGSANEANGENSNVAGGFTNKANKMNSNVGGGNSNTADGEESTVSGGFSNIAAGNSSTVSGGLSNTAYSYGEWTGGLFGTIYNPGSKSVFIDTDRIFNVGNGSAAGVARSDAFTILKNGLATLPSATNLLIAGGGSKAIVTKEYANANYAIVNSNAPASSGAIGIPGEIRMTSTYIYTCYAINAWVRTPVSSF